MESDLPGFKSLPFMGWQNELSNSQDLHFFISIVLTISILQGL